MEGKKSKWVLSKGYKYYFDASSDDTFKKKHPIGYYFLVALGIFVLLMPAIIFSIVAGILLKSDSGWMLLGVVGGFVFGIGLFNFVAIIIKQYLGHWVSVISFLIGGIMMLISWLICSELIFF